MKSVISEEFNISWWITTNININEKNNGPRIKLWGTPVFSGFHAEV